MAPDEIKTMFQANAALRHISPMDPQRIVIEDVYEKLSRKYIAEYIVGKDMSSGPKKMDMQEALDILVKACQSALLLESEHHPDGITDDQLKSLAIARKMALDRVAEEVAMKD